MEKGGFDDDEVPRVQLLQPSTAPEVDYGVTSSTEEMGHRLLEEMKRGAEFWTMRAGVRQRVISSGLSRERDTERAVVRAMKDLGYHDELINVVYGAHANGVRRQRTGIGSLPQELRCLYPELYSPSPPPPTRGRGRPSMSMYHVGTTTAMHGGGQDGRRRGAGSTEHEPLEHVRKACLRWRANVADELRALAAERGGQFARPRVEDAEVEGTVGSAGARGDSRDEASGAGGVGAGAGGRGRNGGGGTGGFLFDSTDLLEAVSAIRSPNRSDFLPVEGDWGMIHVHLRTPSLEELQVTYRDLSPELHQGGLDDRGGFGEDRFASERLSQGRKVLKGGYASEAMEYAKRGVPDSMRPGVWRVILGLPKVLSRQDVAYFRGLMSEVERTELVTDELYTLDVQFITDDDKYFPFEETLHDVILAFSRDPWVLRHSEVDLHDLVPIGDEAREDEGGLWSGGQGGCCPPCGVQPFRGLVNYAAVLCFLFEEREAVYFALRTMFARHWCRLNAVRSGPGMLLRLLSLFESLLQRHQPRLVLKLGQLGVQPLQLAMPWIQFGFVTFLEADQVLLLWDRLLGYDSLELLPVLAAAVIVFRADLVMQVPDAATVMEVFSDGRQLEVVPLLQAFMFPAW